MTERVYGRNPVLELLGASPRTVRRLYVSNRSSGERIDEIRRTAYEKGIPVEDVGPDRLREMVDEARHQGVVAETVSTGVVSLDRLLGEGPDRGPRRLIVLDQIQDPVNLGKIARSSLYFGVDGLIKTTDRSAPVSDTVVKTSAGAATRLPIAEVTNLRRCLQRLKDEGFWLVGADVSGRTTPEEIPLDRDLAVVVGNEEKGLRRLTRETCDYLVKIPGSGDFDSLNVATAAAVLTYALYSGQDS